MENAPEGMERQSVLRQFRELGVEVVELGRSDFQHLAANCITLEPGKLLMTDTVSDKLKNELARHDVEVIEPESERALGDLRYMFGLHCLTTELVAPPQLKEEL